MPLQRADRLKEPPVVGKMYLVPAILWARKAPWFYSETKESVLHHLQTDSNAKWWPVWGRKHNDVEFFDFPHRHYHIDPRFLTKRHWSEFGDAEHWTGRTRLQTLQGSPLSHTALADGPPKPTLRRMRCTLAHVEWGHPDAEQVEKLNKKFVGQQCAKGRRGFVCPHQLFPLGSVTPIAGVITCPLHGLRVDAATGVCLGAKQTKAPAGAHDDADANQASARPS